jgi:hypothetical protein
MIGDNEGSYGRGTTPGDALRQYRENWGNDVPTEELLLFHVRPVRFELEETIKLTDTY